MKSFSIPLALYLAAACGQIHAEAHEQSKRLRSKNDGVKEMATDTTASTLSEKTRQLLLDFSGYEFWEMYANGATSMEPNVPTKAPTAETKAPAAAPTPYPTTQPPVTTAPIPYPTTQPPVTAAPILYPTKAPTSTFPPITPSPTLNPPPVTSAPTPAEVTYEPTPTGIAPTADTLSPTTAPVETTPAPQATPAPVPGTTVAPTTAPVETPAPQATPAPVPGTTVAPTTAPVVTVAPTTAPAVTVAPTTAPIVTVAPTAAPVVTVAPTAAPVVTVAPTAAPVVTVAPTTAPVVTTAPTTAPVVTTAPTTGAPSLKDRIIPLLFDNGAGLNDPASYQSCALARVEEQEGAVFFTDAKLVQYYALYCIFCSTNAKPNVITDADPRFDNVVNFPGWSNKNGWESNNLDPCSGWHGVVCSNDLVSELNLFDNLLTGIWPPEIDLLASDGERSTGAGAITKIDLYNNEFLFNDFDNSWMSFLGSAMSRLYFQATAFAGSLVPLPPNLFEFDCSFTLIDGGLTDQTFTGLNKLNWALLDGNAYNSSVPRVFGSLPELEFLFISDAFISGDLSYMQGMPKMIEHWIDVNTGLSGQIPSFIGEIRTLRSFSVTQASLTGRIPAALGNLNQMVQLWLYANVLSGPIPSELAIRSLRILQLEGNSFSGTMPEEICQLTRFPSTMDTLGADCAEIGCSTTDCCTCCSLAECNPALFG